MTKDTQLDDRWAQRLASGDGEAAWDEFLAAYRGLIFATIGRLVRDGEERMDAFALVCEKLREDGFRRLRRFEPDGAAKFSTWLVTVVRNLVIDRYRGIHGRRRLAASLPNLTDLQSRIFRCLAESGMSFAEAYESLKNDGSFSGSFGSFLRTVRELHREVMKRAGPLARELIGVDPAVELDGGPVLPDELPLEYEQAVSILETMPADVRAATLLFVVEGVPAEQVARIVGWPSRKSVYNRVYRALAEVRRRLAAGEVAQRDRGARGVDVEQRGGTDP